MKAGFPARPAPLSAEEARAVEPPRRRDDLEAWLRTPHAPSRDPRYEIRRLRPPEYERVFDLVDAAWGRKRPRALYDWMYRRNPLGPARCWLMEEKRDGAAVAAAVTWPWPFMLGTRALDGWIDGDAVVAPHLRGRGVRHILRETLVAHPSRLAWAIGWASEGTVRVTRREVTSFRVLDPIPRCVLRLDRAAPAAPGTGTRGVAIEEVGRFDEPFGALTNRRAGWSGLWSARSAELLSWRYLAHPTREYRAFAASGRSGLEGYAVVGFDAQRATLMELVAPGEGAVARTLLDAVVAASRDAGCRRIAFFGTPSWPHWALLRDAGFAPRDESPRLIVRERSPSPACYALGSWRLGPGDHDAR